MQLFQTKRIGGGYGDGSAGLTDRWPERVAKVSTPKDHPLVGGRRGSSLKTRSSALSKRSLRQPEPSCLTDGDVNADRIH